MTDIVQELKWADQELGASPLFRRAAAEIERLRREREHWWSLVPLVDRMFFPFEENEISDDR